MRDAHKGWAHVLGASLAPHVCCVLVVVPTWARGGGMQECKNERSVGKVWEGCLPAHAKVNVIARTTGMQYACMIGNRQSSSISIMKRRMKLCMRHEGTRVGIPLCIQTVKMSWPTSFRGYTHTWLVNILSSWVSWYVCVPGFLQHDGAWMAQGLDPTVWQSRRRGCCRRTLQFWDKQELFLVLRTFIAFLANRTRPPWGGGGLVGGDNLQTRVHWPRIRWWDGENTEAEGGERKRERTRERTRAETDGNEEKTQQPGKTR